MKLLLDTHTLMWAVDDPSRLGSVGAAPISDPNNIRYVSAATIWELAIKISLGKLALSSPYLDWTRQGLIDLQASILPISLEHAEACTKLPFHHRDPFDRLLIAQSQFEGAVLVSVDGALDACSVKRVW